METRSEKLLKIFEGFKLGSLGARSKSPEELKKEELKKEEANKKDVIDKIFVARQERRTHPSGRQDNGGRWFPSNSEECDCCKSVRSPSKAFPWSYMTHCRTKKHVIQLINKLGVYHPSIVAEYNKAK
jgi:hypothetical protein